MWNPPIALTSEEQKRAARTRKTRQFFVFLREPRHELLDADFQHILGQSYRPEPSGQEPVDAGMVSNGSFPRQWESRSCISNGALLQEKARRYRAGAGDVSAGL